MKSPNVIFARHLPSTRRQQSGETLHQFLQDLRKLSKDCKFKAVTAIRQRLLESDTLYLQIAYDKANSLDLVQKNADTYSMNSAHTAATSSIPQPSALSDDSESSSLAATYPRRSKCYLCGGSYHNRRVCPARDACCNNYNKKGQFRKICRSNSNAGTTATIYEDPSAIAAIHGFPTYNCTTGITAAFPQSLSHAAVPLSIHGHTLTALIDSCSSDSFISENIAKMLILQIKPLTRNMYMALSTMNTTLLGYCEIDLKLNRHDYKNVCLSLLKYMCSYVILGHDFQKQHQHLGAKAWSSDPFSQSHNMRCFCRFNRRCFPIYKHIANV